MAHSLYQLLIILSLIYSTKAQAIVGVLSTTEKQQILNLHNDIRNVVANGNFIALPTATNMNELLWVWLLSYSSVFCCYSDSDNKYCKYLG